MSAIDKAMEKINTARSTIGAQYNGLTHTITNNDYAAYNMASANSRIKDTDYGEEMWKKNRDEVLEQYRIFAMRAQMDSDAGMVRLLR